MNNPRTFFAAVNELRAWMQVNRMNPGETKITIDLPSKRDQDIFSEMLRREVGGVSASAYSDPMLSDHFKLLGIDFTVTVKKCECCHREF